MQVFFVKYMGFSVYEVYNLIIVLSVANRNIPLELFLRLVVTRDASTSIP